jgi:hypothetical protein
VKGSEEIITLGLAGDKTQHPGLDGLQNESPVEVPGAAQNQAIGVALEDHSQGRKSIGNYFVQIHQQHIRLVGANHPEGIFDIRRCPDDFYLAIREVCRRWGVL